MRSVSFRSVLILLALLMSAAVAAGQNHPVPLIYPLTPSATAPGGPAFTLTVNGTGFVSGAVVNWNGSALTTTFVSSSQVTAAVPAANIATAGTAVVTVRNPGPGGGTSNSEDFQITNALTATNFTVFSNNEIDGYRARTSNTLTGDFNGDGKLDLVAYSNGFIYVLPGNGDGTFGNWMASVGPPDPSSSPGATLATADLNGDGVPDLVLMNANGTFIALGNGNGTFRLLGTSLSNQVLLGYLVIADFNGDGFLDLAYATNFHNTGTPGVQVLLGNGDGTFRTGPFTSFTSSTTPQPYAALAAADFNGDGKLDLVVVATGTQSITGNGQLLVFPGNGDGSFRTAIAVPGTSISAPGGPVNAVVGDFNGDGKLDIAYFILQAASGPGAFGDLTVSLGNGDGTFRVPFDALPKQPSGVNGLLLAGDFNGDGKLDLVAGNQLLYGNGDGSFTPYGPPGNLQVIQVGDFNGDGKVDLLAVGTNPSNSSQADLRLLTQVPAAPDFSGGMTPSAQTVVPGGSTNYSGSVVALNGFTGSVALSASGMPAGVTANFSPSTVTGGSGSYTMTVSVASSVPLGTYSIMVTGTSGTLVHSTAVTLIVNSSPGDFSSTLAGSDSLQNIVAGQTATYNIQVSPIGGFNGDVKLSVSAIGWFGQRPLPGAATFSPSTVVGGSGTSTLTITTTNPVPLQDIYVFTISATSGQVTHTGVVYLGISNGPGDFTGTITPSSQTISIGQAATYTANITYLNGFSPNGANAFCVVLSVSGLPPGAQFNVVSQSGCYPTTSQTSTFTISAPPGTPAGTYNLLLVGNGGYRIRERAFTLTIQ